MKPFNANKDIDAMVMAAHAWSNGDPAKTAYVLERLVNGVAFTIAAGCAGQVDGCETMLNGAEAHLQETLAEHAKNIRAIYADFK